MTVCHHLAGIVMPNSDPWDTFLLSALTQDTVLLYYPPSVGRTKITHQPILSIQQYENMALATIICVFSNTTRIDTNSYMA